MTHGQLIDIIDYMDKPLLCMELSAAEHVAPQDVIDSLRHYVVAGSPINPTTYDQAIARSEPPMDAVQLDEVISLAVEGIATNHTPRQPLNYERAGFMRVGCNETQQGYTALLGAASLRRSQLVAQQT